MVGCFLIAREDTSVVLGLIEKTLHQVAIFIEVGVIGARLETMGARRDDWRQAALTTAKTL